jgi:L-fuculose-phosphate aldolase
MMLLEKYIEEVNIFVEVCHKLARNMYVTSQGGNLAWRLEPDLILITPTQVYKGDLQNDDVVFIDLTGKVIEGKHRPTGETPMYLTFLNKRPDVISVIHCHPPGVCAIAILKGKNWLMRPLYPETTIELGPVPIVPYGEPLTQELASLFEPLLPKYNNFIMENHGLVSMSRGDIKWTLGQVELMEMTVQSIALALQMGEIQEISHEALLGLSKVMKTRNLPLMGAPGVNKDLVDLYSGND